MRLTASQLAALVDGMDWPRLHAHDVGRPTATSRALRIRARCNRLIYPILATVAPRAEARIETQEPDEVYDLIEVAPPAGAWTGTNSA
jgi:hypothetical protein